MKVLPFKIPKTKNIALLFQEDTEQIFYDQLHQHEEIQICAIIHGEGTLVVGDTINEYKAGDVLVIGSNLPHVFKSDVERSSKSQMYSLFFTKNSFGEGFFSLGDFAALEDFFEKSKAGFKVSSDHKTKLFQIFLSLKKATTLERFILFFQSLDLFNKAETIALSTFVYQKKYTDNEGKRMSTIMDYTMNHFDKDIDLQSISDVATMTPNAFCRYFKQRTNKTYFQFLIEVRIEQACRFLKNHELLITEVSEKSGFKNISNFNRKFKEIKGAKPTQFRSLQ